MTDRPSMVEALDFYSATRHLLATSAANSASRRDTATVLGKIVDIHTVDVTYEDEGPLCDECAGGGGRNRPWPCPTMQAVHTAIEGWLT